MATLWYEIWHSLAIQFFAKCHIGRIDPAYANFVAIACPGKFDSNDHQMR